MTQIRTEAEIRRSPDDVFTYVTTPANWPRWHPSSIAVSGDANHPLDVGETCVEEFVVAGRHGITTWTVRERVVPSRWIIEASPPNGGHAEITYALEPAGSGTHFVRTLRYRMPNAALAILDLLAIRQRVEAESIEATRRLKKVLEAAVPVG
jgi:uncharacterized protein YndB with AHSA1/START domain